MFNMKWFKETPSFSSFVFILLFLIYPALSPLHAETMVRVRILEGRIPDTIEIQSEGPVSYRYGGKEKEFSGALRVVCEKDSVLITSGEKKYRATTPVTLTPTGNGLFSVKTNQNETRAYRGAFEIINDSGEMVLINILSLEDYLVSVVPSEMEGTELEALKAQAIVSRTVALKNLNKHATDGPYDFCDLTHCQSYRGADAETAMATRAVTETAGMIVTYDGTPAQLFYHASSGGMTTAPKYVWDGPDIPYLVPVIDRVDNRMLGAGDPHMHWEFRIEREKLLGLLGDALGTTATGIAIDKRDPSGRVMVLTIDGPDEKYISGEAFRILMGRSLGWHTIKSSLFDLTQTDDYFVFRGRGLGHGVGMSQAGALELSRMGRSCYEIIRFYFPGTEVEEMTGAEE
jgi:stage II sporulation protein D